MLYNRTLRQAYLFGALRWLCATSLPSAAYSARADPPESSSRPSPHRRQLGQTHVVRKLVQGSPPDGLKYADASYSGWAMIIRTETDSYKHSDVTGSDNGATVVLDFPDCLAEGKVWDGLDVQTYNWNLVDAQRTACQTVYLRGVPDTGGGEEAAEGAFVISPNGRNTTQSLTSTQGDGWKPLLRAPPGPDESNPDQMYQIMCADIDLNVESQLYLGAKCIISIRSTVDISVWTVPETKGSILSMPYGADNKKQHFNILKLGQDGRPLAPAG